MVKAFILEMQESHRRGDLLFKRVTLAAVGARVFSRETCEEAVADIQVDG